MAQGREIFTTKLTKQLGSLVSSMELAAKSNLGSAYVVAETILMGLLNRVYGWNLVNVNAARHNCPGIDLIDETRHIGVQVTVTRTPEKVRNTLEATAKSGFRCDRLIILVITNHEPTAAMKDALTPGSELWNIPRVFTDAATLPMERLEPVTVYLAMELGSAAALRYLELPPRSALPPSGFVGRGQELAEIRSRFARGDTLVVLTGLGGMGKTELAVRCGREHPGLTHFVRFDTNFGRTLSNMALGIRPALTEEELRQGESYLGKKVLDILEKSSSEDLLIIDNVDSETGILADLPDDPVYLSLRKLPLQLLLTTRSDADRPIPVEPMPDEPLFEIFRHHKAELTAGEMEKLIRAVDGHTLTIDLIARTIADNWVPVSADEMLDAIENSTLSQEDFPETGTDYNNDPKQLHIYQRLRGVFQVAKIPPLEQQLLRLATLLPDSGMDVRLFRKALAPELLKVFPGLGKRGWLEIKSGLLTIHPVIRLVCRTEQPLTVADCSEFLNKLWAQYNPIQYRFDYYSQMADLFLLAHDTLGKKNGRWLNWSGILLNALLQHQRLHDMYYLRLPELNQSLPSNSTELAIAYNYYGLSLEVLGHYDSALICGEKALTIWQSASSEADADLAKSYNNVGSAYGRIGKHQKALEYKLKALDIFKRALPPYHPDLATSCVHVGYTYNELGDHCKALEYNLRALAIREKILSPLHPALASAYSYVGYTFCCLGNYNQALNYNLKALDIRKKTLSPEHLDLAKSYSNVGDTYRNLGSYYTALEYQLKALKIREQALPPEHPDLALSCSNIAWSYHELGELIKAASYMRQAADIIGRSDLPKTHPDRINFPKWADELEQKARLQQMVLAQQQTLGSIPLPPFQK